MKKIIYEDVKYFIEVESNSGCKLISKVYVNYDEKLEVQCNCGEIFYISFDKFKHQNKRQCNKCGKLNISQKQSFSFEYVKNFIEVESDSNCILLSNEYKNVGSLLKIQCICGEIFNTTFSCFKYKNKRKCDSCSNSRKRNKSSLNIDNLKNYVKNTGDGCELLSDVYIDCKQKLKFRCKCGNIFYTTLSHFKNDFQRRCKECGTIIRTKARRLLFDNVKENVEAIDGYKLISDEYKNNSTKLNIKCPNNHIFYMEYANFRNGQRCPECFEKKRSGETAPNWKGGITNLRIYIHICDEIKSWKIKSMQLCWYKCILTGEKHDAVHHLYSFNKILTATFKELNMPIYSTISFYTTEQLEIIKLKCLELHLRYPYGVCLTGKLHSLYHTLYKFDNTPEQFKEFITRLRLGEFNDFLKENNLELNINYDVLNKLII
jgi:hypothetical protein